MGVVMFLMIIFLRVSPKEAGLRPPVVEIVNENSSEEEILPNTE